MFQCILGISDVTYYQTRTGSQCFHVKGVPTLNLRCPSAQMIKIHQAFYGAPPLNSTCWYEIQTFRNWSPYQKMSDLLDTNSDHMKEVVSLHCELRHISVRLCRYSSRDNHCIQYTDLHENCMGRYICSVYVSNPFLMNCRVYANYMQINYTCIPSEY